MQTRSLHRRIWVVALASAALLLSACGSDFDADESVDSSYQPEFAGDSDESEDVGQTASAAVATTEGEAATEEDTYDDAEPAGSEPQQLTATASGSGAVVPAADIPADLGRKIIFTAEVELDVDDVAAAGAEAVRAIESVNGFVFGQSTTGGTTPVSIFTFKVRPEDFDRALSSLGGIGDLRSQSIGADDVTERVVNLASRIEVAELGVARLRAALEAAPSLEDYAELELLLLNRETDLEVMKGQLRTLQDRVDLATITLVLRQDRVQNALDLSVTSYEAHDGGISCPGDRERRPVVEGTDLTVCYEVVNVGDQAVTELTITDPGLGVDADHKPMTVFGSLSEPLEPGQSVVLAVETVPERSLRLRVTVGARPIAGESGEAGPPVSAKHNMIVGVEPNPERAGFTDSFDAGVSVLAAIWYAIIMAVAFAIPLLPVVLGAIGLLAVIRTIAKRRPKPEPTPEPTPAQSEPPPPTLSQRASTPPPPKGPSDS